MCRDKKGKKAFVISVIIIINGVSDPFLHFFPRPFFLFLFPIQFFFLSLLYIFLILSFFLI